MHTNSWTIDEAHSGIHFTVNHMVVARVHGQFRRWSAELPVDEADLTRSTATVTIDAGSIDTGNAQRDAHLRSPDFLDADKFPALTFHSRRIEPAGKGRYRVTGNLTIRDVAREVTVDVELGGFVKDPWGARRVGVTATASILRSEFGMVWNQLLEAGGLAVSDRVDIRVEIEAVAQALAA